ncbi:MAG: Ysc84 actin-binding domain protein [Blastopirellula sp.]|nr:Ysc84 actin-binding domain protein [Blastopirellula sp.]
MNRTHWLLGRALLAVAVFMGMTHVASGQYLEEATVKNAQAVLTEAMTKPSTGVPQAMLADAYGVAVIPNVLKGGFVVGARHGRGVLMVRDDAGLWHAPVFVTLTGGNIGWQVGVQSSDVILVFKTRKSVEGILSGKLTLGADAAAAAGPVGRETSVGTDARLKAEVYSYSRSRGLFAGVAIDGSVLKVDQLATGAYYGNPRPGETVVVPEAAQRLTQAVATYAGAKMVAPSEQPIAQKHSASDADVLRSQLTKLAPQLYELLDSQWKSYLALPAPLFLDGAHADLPAVEAAVARFAAVANDPRYQQLAVRPEFQSVYGILRHYQQSLTQAAPQLQLPPPPSAELR